MKRKFSLVMSAAMILSLIAPMTNALAEDIQTPETATPETVVTEDAASGGTTYYVDSTIGDDSNSGTSPETPWKSLDKVTATTFLPGDTILLKVRLRLEWRMVMAKRLRNRRCAYQDRQIRR